MKKEYSKPSMKAHKIKPAQMICGSGGNSAKIAKPSDGEEQPQATTTIWGTGIFGE